MREQRRAGVVRRLRREPTVAERRLWERLRRREVGGWKFRRQADFGRFVIDFLSHDAGLAVEIDGPVHALFRADVDKTRDAEIQAAGYRVLRIAERDVRERLEWVLGQIVAAASPPPCTGEGQGRGAPTPDPSPASEGGEICGVSVSAFSAHELRRLRRYERRLRADPPTPDPSPASEGGG